MEKWLRSPSSVAALALIPTLLTIYHLSKFNSLHRPSKVPHHLERVLVVGASSGIGRSIARQYAQRGARVCVVGRRRSMINDVVNECRSARASHPDHKDSNIIGLAADFANVDDMVAVRSQLESEWGGIDTLVVAAGVSALQPLMAVAGVAAEGKSMVMPNATAEGIQNAANVANAAARGNYIGPLIAAVTFIPLLSNTSKAPSIVLVNSLASVIPAPTRTVYASSKAASLVLYQALSIEHPNIKFSHILPSTVEGDFRASAVDSGPVREADPNKHGLKREAVAARCILAADRAEKHVFMPRTMGHAHILYWFWPSFIEAKARKKYNFSA